MIRIYGPYNTGTNLTSNLLNFILEKRTKVEYIEKHTLNKSLIEKFLNQNTYNRIVINYRPILSWLRSLEKESYQLNYKNIYSKKLKFVHVYRKYPENKDYYDDIFDLYNSYYKLYFELKEKYGDRVVLLNYEKLISPEFNKNNEYLKEKFPKGQFDEKHISNIFNRPAKTHGKSVESVSKSYEKFQKDINSWTTDEKEYIFKRVNIDIDFFDKN